MNPNDAMIQLAKILEKYYKKILLASLPPELITLELNFTYRLKTL